MENLTQEEIRAIDCIMLHFRTFMNQAADEAPADFGKPCQICKYAEECKFDWLTTLEPLLQHTNIPIFGKEKVIHCNYCGREILDSDNYCMYCRRSTK